MVLQSTGVQYVKSVCRIKNVFRRLRARKYAEFGFVAVAALRPNFDIDSLGHFEADFVRAYASYVQRNRGRKAYR